MIVILIILIPYSVYLLVGLWIGRKKNRPVLGAVLGGTLLVLGLIIIDIMPEKELINEIR